MKVSSNFDQIGARSASKTVMTKRRDERTEQKNNDGQEPVLDFTERFIIVGYNIYLLFENIFK